MSREWGYRCKSCDSESVCEINHGELLLRSLVKVYPHIKAIQDNDKSGYIQISILGYAWIDLVSWLDEHAGHEIELIDEYGKCEPLEEPKT